MVYGEASTGAESDIQQLTQIARGMVGRWGMSEAIGPLSALPPDGGYFPGASEMSARSLDLIDSEVRRIVDQAHTEVVALLNENREKLDSLAERAARARDARRGRRLRGGRRPAHLVGRRARARVRRHARDAAGLAERVERGLVAGGQLGELRLVDHERGGDLQAAAGECARDHAAHLAARRRGAAGQRRIGSDRLGIELHRRQQAGARADLGDERVSEERPRASASGPSICAARVSSPSRSMISRFASAAAQAVVWPE